MPSACLTQILPEKYLLLPYFNDLHGIYILQKQSETHCGGLYAKKSSDFEGLFAFTVVQSGVS
ncbi:MAG: hypothetical protein NZ455_07865 [Bacteroidia bacterium]|nr:hypothetical protein [Bacteroidia bacterium]